MFKQLNFSKLKKKMSDVSQKEWFWKITAAILVFIIVITQFFNVSVRPKYNLQRGTKVNFENTRVSGSTQSPSQSQPENLLSEAETKNIISEVLPEQGVVLPITWGNLGKKMVDDGVIDETKFRSLFETDLTDEEEQLLLGNNTGPIIMNQQNSRYLLDLLWAFGLANKNAILENGEMADKQFGGAQNFASTGGWSLAKGSTMNHYSAHQYVVLTSEEQALVDKVSKNIYRPCCGNSTHFPDCNHGMAMLGLLELMAKNGASENQMYQVALKVNSFWFPQTYIELATYFQEQGQSWNEVDPKTVLSSDYSSATGYQKTRESIQNFPQLNQGGNSCGA